MVHGDLQNGSTRYWNYLEDSLLCVGGLSAVNAIGTQLRDPINSGLTQWQLTVYVDTVAESGSNPASKHQTQREYGEWAGFTRDGTTEPVSRNLQILGREQGRGNLHFPCSADHEQDWQPYPVDLYSTICVMTILHTQHYALHYKYSSALCYRYTTLPT